MDHFWQQLTATCLCTRVIDHSSRAYIKTQEWSSCLSGRRRILFTQPRTWTIQRLQILLIAKNSFLTSCSCKYQGDFHNYDEWEFYLPPAFMNILMSEFIDFNEALLESLSTC